MQRVTRFVVFVVLCGAIQPIMAAEPNGDDKEWSF